MTQGVAPTGLLLSAKVLVHKIKRGSKSDSSNYRAIAISSILSKLIYPAIKFDRPLSLITEALQLDLKTNIPHLLLHLQNL